MEIDNSTRILICIGIMLILINLIVGYKSSKQVEHMKNTKIEHMEDTKIDNVEMVQNIASVYNNKNMIVDKVTTTSDFEINGNTTLKGDTTITGKVSSDVSLVKDKKICINNKCITESDIDNVLKMRNKYLNELTYSQDPKNYDMYEIADAFTKGVMKQNGSGNGYTKFNAWSGAKNHYQFGVASDNKGGGTVIIPEGKTVLWLRVLNDRWATFDVLDSSGNKLLSVGSGKRQSLNFAPDGSNSQTEYNRNAWVPVALKKSGTYKIVNNKAANNTLYFSGVGFSTNPWNHAMFSALTYYWKMNGSDPTVWSSDLAAYDNLAYIKLGTVTKLRVPVIPSGNDKLVYIIGDGPLWSGNLHQGVTVNGKTVPRFKETWDNPFSRRTAGRAERNYYATKIPKEYIKENDTFIDLVIDMSKSNNHWKFREIGTHDHHEF